MNSLPLRIRKATKRDIAAIVAIENQQFTNPWKESAFLHELDHRIAYFYVAEERDTGDIAGYILFWIICETAELHDIAVAGKYQKRGIGRQLMDFFLETARRQKVEELFLEVRASNHPAIALYEKYEFSLINRRKEYYQQPLEDALIYGLYLQIQP